MFFNKIILIIIIGLFIAWLISVIKEYWEIHSCFAEQVPLSTKIIAAILTGTIIPLLMLIIKIQELLSSINKWWHKIRSVGT